MVSFPAWVRKKVVDSLVLESCCECGHTGAHKATGVIPRDYCVLCKWCSCSCQRAVESGGEQ